MKPFEYFSPSSVEEALALLEQYGDQATIMAGGTDLMPALNGHTISPKYVIHLDKLDELRYISQDTDCIRIGALVTFNELIDSNLISTKLTALAMAAEESSAPQVRNLGIIGGNLGTASPAGDLTVALAALKARVKVSDKNGTKEYAVEEFIVGPKKNIMTKDQMIVEIIVPNLPDNTRSSFQKIGKRKANTISVVCAAAAVTVDQATDAIKEARISLGSVGPSVIIAQKYGSALAGVSINSDKIKELSELVKEEISPITDVRSTAEYRYEVAGVLAARCVENSLIGLAD
jgi:xanthine dehydrogenase FAD-binding subunit